MSIESFLSSLVSEASHPVLDEILQHVDPQQTAEYKQAFATVSKILNRVMHGNPERLSFDTNDLKRVIKHFSNEVAEQHQQRAVLEAILRFAITHHQIKSAKIPQLLTLRRDIPALSPTMLVHTGAAMKLYKALKADLSYPKKLKSVQLEVGRLASVLYLIEGVSDLATTAKVLRQYKLFYAGSVIYLTDPADSTGQKRYVIQLYTALLFQLIKRQELIEDFVLEDVLKKVLRSSKSTASCIQDYLRLVTKQADLVLSVTKLKNYRLIYWTSHFSPVEAGFLLQRFKSILLPNDVFIRTTLNQSRSRDDIELRAKINPTIEDTSKILQQHSPQHGSGYQKVEQTISLIQKLISLVKKKTEPLNASYNPFFRKAQENRQSKNNRKPYQAVINRISENLQLPEFSQNFYVVFFGSYIIHLLKNGGRRKNLLSFQTVRDYVSSPLKFFIESFTDVDFLKIDEEALTEKLNSIGKLMAPTRRGYLYYLADFIQQLGLITDFIASNLNLRSGASKVNANIISVPQVEQIIQFIHAGGQQYNNAVLLLCLGFYSGARRGEAKFIRVSDFELQKTETGTEVVLKIVPTRARSLKTLSGTRTINLNVFWPRKWLEILIQKLEISRAAGFSKTDRLFDDSIDQSFILISQLLRTYVADMGFIFHNLRHSFVCWQYYRLVLQPRLKANRGENMHCFQHEYFSEKSCFLARQKLGLPGISRKAVYALCSLVGHADPITTFGSYLHLRDLYCYLLISSELCITQKALSQLVVRSKIDSDLLQQFPAGAIDLGTLFDKETMNIKPEPVLSQCQSLSRRQLKLKQIPNLPSLRQLEFGLQLIGKMQPDDVTSLDDNGAVISIEGGWLNTLRMVCDEVQNSYPERSKKLPKLPLIAKSKGQLRADKKISNSRQIFESLQASAQIALAGEVWNESQIVKALEALKGLMILQNWTIQFKDPERLDLFLQLCTAILPKNIKPKVTIYSRKVIDKDIDLERWFKVFSPHKNICAIRFETVEKPEFWSENLKHSVAWLYFEKSNITKVTNPEGQSPLVHEPQRASSVVYFLHFLLVACITRLRLSDK